MNPKRMAAVPGVEPVGVGESTPVSKRGEELSPEGLTHILTNFTDVDRRMLSQIVERWGGLSEELKMAVLALVGYYLRYRYGDMPTHRYRSLGVSDKEVALELANDFKREYEAEKAGILLPKPLREAAHKALSEHLGEYLADLRSRGKTGRRKKGLVQIRSRLQRLFDECDWNALNAITPDSFVRWRSGIRDLSPRTLNHYLSDACTFLNWMVRQGRLAFNPLKAVGKVDQTVSTRERRAFTDDEICRLVEYSPQYRRVPYLMSARTGLRHGELSQLLWGDIVLDEGNSHVRVRASISKNKKEARIPLIRELEILLAEFRPVSVGDADKVFVKGVPRCRTLRKDLEAADIPYCDEQGRYADFHSLRYTFNTWMQRKGFVPRVAQELMRHSDRRLTDKVYTDTNLLPLQQSMRNISEDVPLMHILMHICGKTCLNESQSVATDQSSETTETSVTVGDRRELSQSDDLRVWWRWRESNPRPVILPKRCLRT